MFGLDNAIIPFIARAGSSRRASAQPGAVSSRQFSSRCTQSAIVAALAIAIVQARREQIRPGSADGGGAFGSALRDARREFVSDLHRGLARDEGDEARHLLSRPDGSDRHNDRISCRSRARLEGLRRRDCRHHRHGRVRTSRVDACLIAFSFRAVGARRNFLPRRSSPFARLLGFDQRLRFDQCFNR